MTKGLEEILDDLHDIEGMEAVILYRMDGVPVTLRVSSYREGLLETMYWLEKQIKFVLRDMNTEGLMDTVFFFRNNRILIAPASRSIVLVTIAAEEANQQLISLETLRATKIIKESVS